jgi:integrase
MATVAKFTPRYLDALKITTDREFEVSEISGLRCFVKQSKSFGYRYRRPPGTPNAGKQAKLIFGRYPQMSLAEARRRHDDAEELRNRGIDPGAVKQATKAEAKAKASDTLQAVAERWLKREGRKLRTAGRVEYDLKTYVFPCIGGMPVASIRKSTVVAMLEEIEDTVRARTAGAHDGERTAQRAFALVSQILNWFALRSDDFVNPLPRGLRQMRSRARDRTLTDQEIAAVWHAAGELGTFGDVVRGLLLTGARRSELAEMEWSEVTGELWTLPAARNKPSRYDRPIELVRPLAPATLAILARQPRVVGCLYVFSRDGRHPIREFAKAKCELDRLSGVSGWVLHDLRRTARTLMGRARVPTDHAERALGHVIGGIRATYDKFEYLEEKAQAFTAVANLVARIVDPQDNVTVLKPTNAA